MLLEVSCTLKSCTHLRGRTKTKEPIQQGMSKASLPHSPQRQAGAAEAKVRTEFCRQSCGAQRSDRRRGTAGIQQLQAGPSSNFRFSWPLSKLHCSLRPCPCSGLNRSFWLHLKAQHKGSQRWPIQHSSSVDEARKVHRDTGSPRGLEPIPHNSAPLPLQFGDGVVR